MALPKVGVEAVIEGMAKFEADSRKVNKSLDDMGTNTSKLGSIASGVTSKITSLAGSLLKIGTIGAGVAIAGIGAGLYTAASAGLSFNNAMEQAGAKINAFTKDADLTAQILEDVRLEAAKTPFEFEAMANAVSGLLPAAKQADVAIMDLLKDAEVLAASNPAEGLEGAAFALREAVSGDFTSVIERFNLPRSMINKLKEEGLPALEIVRTAMNEMGYDMDLVSALANTAEGRWSTFKDTLTNLAGTVTQPIFEALSQGLADINSFLTANEPLLTQMATILAGQVSEALTLVAQKATELFAAFQQGGMGGVAEALGLGELVAMWATVQPILSDLWTWLGTNIPSAIKTVSDLWNNNLLPGFTQIYDAVNAQLVPALQKLSDVFLGATGNSQSFAELWTSTLQPALMAVGDFLINTLFPAWVQMQVFFVGALATAITALADYWQNYLFPAISMTSEFIAGTLIPTLTNLWDWLGPKLGTAIETTTIGIQTMADFWTQTLQPALVTVFEYSSRNLIPLLESIGNLFNAVINKAIQASAGLWQNVLFPALKKVGDFLNATLFPVFQSLGKTVKEDVSPGLSDLGEKILPMIQEAMDYVNEAVKRTISFFNSLASTINKMTLPTWLQMQSPPPLATALNLVAGGANAATQAVQGMLASLTSSKWSNLQTKIFDVVDDMQDEGYYASRGFGKATGHAIKEAFQRAFNESFEGIMSGTISGEQLAEITKREAGAYADRVHGSFNTIVERTRAQGMELLMQMQQDLRDALPGIANSLSGLAGGFVDIITKETEAIKKLKGETGALMDVVFKGSAVSKDLARQELIQKFLVSDQEELVITSKAQTVYGELLLKQTYDRVTAQQELNRLMAEQAERERQITAQKEAQEKLGFLQMQLDLLKQGKALGVNVFSGLKFGLEASASDLLTVTNRLVEAMVGQINKDLQIQSPSAVMMEIGQQMMAGLQSGIVSMTPMLNAQLSASVAGPLSPMMAGAMNSSSNSTTNNFNMGGNNISNGMQAAEFEARILQVIRRNL